MYQIGAAVFFIGNAYYKMLALHIIYKAGHAGFVFKAVSYTHLDVYKRQISALQMHEKGIIVCDDAATAELKVGTYRYFKDIIDINKIYG